MVVLGLGIGSFMQVMTVAVQNSVAPSDLGSATSMVIFFRSIGSSFGAALFGSILNIRLTHHLQQLLPTNGELHLTAKNFQASAKQLHSLSPGIIESIHNALALSFRDIFLIGTPLTVITFLVALRLKEVPLRTSTHEVNPAP